MSFLSTRFVPVVRNISPCLRLKFSQNNGFQRFYFRRRGAFSELSSALESVDNYMSKISPVVSKRRRREIPVRITGDCKSYKLELDVKDVEPEDVCVTLKNNELRITSYLHKEFENGSEFSRENSYHHILPSDINPDAIRSSITEGILTIEAPLPALESKEIPVNIENGDSSSNSESGKK